jgi:hypothetical protein
MLRLSEWDVDILYDALDEWIQDQVVGDLRFEIAQGEEDQAYETARGLARAGRILDNLLYGSVRID